MNGELAITAALAGEHGPLYAQLAWLEQAGPESPETVRAAAALLAAGLASHAEIEDELLFRPLEADLGPGGGPLQPMRAEHDEVEAALTRLQEAGSSDEARELAADLARAARGHFGKEEQVLFPLAEQLLDTAELRRLGAEWASRRRG